MGDHTCILNLVTAIVDLNAAQLQIITTDDQGVKNQEEINTAPETLSSRTTSTAHSAQDLATLINIDTQKQNSVTSELITTQNIEKSNLLTNAAIAEHNRQITARKSHSQNDTASVKSQNTANSSESNSSLDSLPPSAQQQLREDLMVTGTSIATKVVGRLIMLELINYDSIFSFAVTNCLYAIPAIAIAGAVVRGILETGAITHNIAKNHEVNFVTILALIFLRKAKDDKEAAFLKALLAEIFNKRTAVRCAKTGGKLATVYTAWAIATFSLKVLVAMAVIAVCWKAVIIIVGAAIITGIALGLINYLVDRKDNCVQNGVVRGVSEGAVWSWVEQSALYRSIGIVGDCMIVSATVSFAYCFSAVLHNFNKQITFSQEKVIDRFKDWTSEKFTLHNINSELKEILDEAGYNTTWHKLTGSYSSILRTMEKTVKLYVLQKYAKNPQSISEENVITVCKKRRHWFDVFNKPTTFTLFKNIKNERDMNQNIEEGNHNTTHIKHLEKQIAEQATHFAPA